MKADDLLGVKVLRPQNDVRAVWVGPSPSEIAAAERRKTIRAGLVGASMILAGMIVAGVLKPQMEAYPQSMQALCETQMLAAVMVQENGVLCPGSADFGHSEGTLALCRLSRGRSPEQVARLPQCRWQGGSNVDP